MHLPLKNEGEKIPRVRNYIAQLALKRARNVWRKYCAKKRSTVDENGVRVARVTSMGDFTEEEVEKLVKKITNEIFHNADEDMRKEEMLVMLDEVLDECRARKILSEEDLQIICHTYGYGEGYELLKNQEIAQKLNRSDGYVTKHREAALKKLYAFLLEKKKKNDEQ